MVELNSQLNSGDPVRSRALLRIVGTEDEGETMRVVVPGWKPRRIIPMPTRLMPDEVIQEMGEWLGSGPFRVLAEVDLSARRARDLKPTNFELIVRPQRGTEL